MNDIKMTSGIGQKHTNEADPNKPTKQLTPYSGITWTDIQALVDKPQQVEKPQAQWLIPSSHPSRSFKEQEQHGQFFMLCGDLDKNPPTLPDLAVHIGSLIPGCNYELYNTSSATPDNQKARLLIPLHALLSGTDWTLAQETFGDKLEALGIIPDRAAERPAQLCYLPNKGAFYGSLSKRDGVFFDPMQTWANEITAKRDELEAQREAQETAKQTQLERRAALQLSGTIDTFQRIKDTFNAAYSCEELLEKAGYCRKGSSFRHPHSETGNFSATVKDGRVHALSSNDPLYSEKGAHDAISVFTTLHHGGDINAALRDAGDNLLTIGCVSYNKAVQQEHAKRQAEQHTAKLQQPETLNIDHSTMPDYGEVVPPCTPLYPMTKKENALFKFADASELMNRAYAPDFLIKTLFETNSLGQIFGATGSGKSFVVLDMAYCIATGLDYHGLTTKQGNVAYICGEGFRAIGRRVRALHNKYNANFSGKLFISEQPGAFIDPGVTQNVAQAISAIGNVNLVIIDTYHRNMGGGGNENSADDFGVILRNIDTFLKPLNVAVLIVHHSGHIDTDRSRGSSAIRAAMDFEYQVTKASDAVTLKPTKIKDGTTPPPLFFSLVDSEIGLDHEGIAITSAYLDRKEGGTATKGARSRLSAHDDAVLQTLNDAIAAQGIEPSAEIKAKFGGFDSFDGKLQKIVHVDQWRKLAYKAITVDCDTEEGKPQALKKAFKRSRDKLFNEKYTVQHGDYVWRFFDENKG